MKTVILTATICDDHGRPEFTRSVSAAEHFPTPLAVTELRFVTEQKLHPTKPPQPHPHRE